MEGTSALLLGIGLGALFGIPCLVFFVTKRMGWVGLMSFSGILTVLIISTIASFIEVDLTRPLASNNPAALPTEQSVPREEEQVGNVSPIPIGDVAVNTDDRLAMQHSAGDSGSSQADVKP